MDLPKDLSVHGHYDKGYLEGRISLCDSIIEDLERKEED